MPPLPDNDFIRQLAAMPPGGGAMGLRGGVGGAGGGGNGAAGGDGAGNGFGGGSGGAGGGGGAWRGGGRNAGPREPLGKLFDREPPRAIEAEMSLLGAMILDPRLIADVLQIIKGPEAFYDPRHGAIYQSLVYVYDKHHSGDLVQIRQHLADRGALEQVGGEAYLEQLASAVPVASNAPHFARIVAEKHKLRRLIEAAGQVLYETYHAGRLHEEDAGALVDAAEQKIFEIAQDESAGDPQGLSQLLQLEYDRLMAIEDGRAAPDGVRTGFHDLDEMLGGLQPGEMIILAARPSMGKTALALNLAEQMALGTSDPGSHTGEREAMPVGVFSLEMSKASLVQRLLSAWSGLDSAKIRRGSLHASDYDRLLHACDSLARAPMYIDDTPGLTLLQLRARARRMVQRYNVRALVVDYLQLLTAPGAARESRQVEVSAISRGVKALARELKLPIVCLSQLNRGPESRDQNRPRLSDLRESGSLEQDADVVLLLHREEYYHIGDEEWLNDNPDKRGVAELIVAKQRNGPTGSVNLTWDSHTTRFKNYSGSGGGPGWAREDAPPAPQRQTPGMAMQYPAVAPRAGAVAGRQGAQPVPPPARPTPPPLVEPRLKRPGAFHPGRATGPVANHRDGGGPEREASDQAQQEALREDAAEMGDAREDDALPPPMAGEGEDDGPAPF